MELEDGRVQVAREAINIALKNYRRRIVRWMK
jgi:hypothetical protein